MIWELLWIEPYEIANILSHFTTKMAISFGESFIWENIQTEREEMSAEDKTLSGKHSLLRVERGEI